MGRVTISVFRGDAAGGKMVAYEVETFQGMVLLDAVHQIQAEHDSTLACRWNCKAAKCGSCSAEINGQPKLLCKTPVAGLAGEEITVGPMRAFPLIKDLVTDVSWNYRVSAKIPPLVPKSDAAGRPFRLQQIDVDRIQEFRKCIECFLCQNVCHILRDHERFDGFFGPRQMVKVAALEMHPMDGLNRREQLRGEAGVGFCNITKCCTEVCPEHIHITDNAIIPLKERVVDDYFDPVAGLLRGIGIIRRKDKQPMSAVKYDQTRIHAAEDRLKA
ncbi:MAG TPA: succinate dehydrogenase/fumarate reductase iron-sulfur subunit [Chthonomonadaceae bacterium]|nr:succinate dehydrogenase/fumarate reductase iron-sulfur subunit [Chthonomonadaceae bacterium]